MTATRAAESKPSQSSADAPDDALPSRLLVVLHWLFHYCLTRRGSLFYGLMFASFTILMIAPIWTLPYLPLGDLPDHAGQIRAILEFEYYEKQYRINWLTPYLAAYVVTMALGKLMPVVVAIKVVLSVCLLAFPISVAMLIAQLRGDRFWVISAFPVAYCFSFFWGFYSCLLGTSVMLFFMVFLVAYAKRPSSIKWFFAAAGLSLLLFFAHAIPWGFAALVAPLILFMHGDVKTSLKKLVPIYAIVPIVVYWMSISGRGGGASVVDGHHVEYYLGKVATHAKYFVDMFDKQTREGLHGLRAKELLCYAIGRAPSWSSILLTTYLVIWPVLYSARFRFKYRRWLPFLLVVALFMLVPYFWLESFYVYCRFAVFLIPVAYFLYDRKTRRTELRQGRVKKVFKYGSILAALVCSGYLLVDNLLIFLSFRKDVRDFATVVDTMEMDKTALFLIFDQRSRQPLATAYAHFGGWYQSEKRGTPLYSFSHDPIATSVPLRYMGKSWPMPDSWSPKTFDWRKHQGDRYDYFVVRAKSPQDALFRSSKGSVVMLAQHGDWYLYGKKKYLPPFAKPRP